MYFGYKMSSEPATITFDQDAEAKNIAGDDGGPQTLTLDLGGNTLKLFNESEIKSSLTLIDGTVAATNHLIVQPGATLTLGPDSTLKATGISNQVQVNDGGTLDLAGGRLEEMSGLRDLALNSGATLIVRDGGSLKVRAGEIPRRLDDQGRARR